MNDLISRQAVLNLLHALPPEEVTTKAMLIQSVKQMDAAQPDGPDNLVKDSQGLAKELVNDTISREAAITAIQNAYCDTEGGEDKCAVWKNVGLTNALHIMQDLPSAQSEITLESAIDYLHSIGWMQEHDRILTESAQPSSSCSHDAAQSESKEDN